MISEIIENLNLLKEKGFQTENALTILLIHELKEIRRVLNALPTREHK